MRSIGRYCPKCGTIYFSTKVCSNCTTEHVETLPITKEKDLDLVKN